VAGEQVLENAQGTYGNFRRPIDDLVSFMALPAERERSGVSRDYPWRRRAYDRTLSCPDLARVINDFLSSDIDFANEDMPVQLCA
jgi:hypothetical protein